MEVSPTKLVGWERCFPENPLLSSFIIYNMKWSFFWQRVDLARVNLVKQVDVNNTSFMLKTLKFMYCTNLLCSHSFHVNLGTNLSTLPCNVTVDTKSSSVCTSAFKELRPTKLLITEGAYKWVVTEEDESSGTEKVRKYSTMVSKQVYRRWDRGKKVNLPFQTWI